MTTWKMSPAAMYSRAASTAASNSSRRMDEGGSLTSTGGSSSGSYVSGWPRAATSSSLRATASS